MRNADVEWIKKLKAHILDNIERFSQDEFGSGSPKNCGCLAHMALEVEGKYGPQWLTRHTFEDLRSYSESKERLYTEWFTAGKKILARKLDLGVLQTDAVVSTYWNTSGGIGDVPSAEEVCEFLDLMMDYFADPVGSIHKIMDEAWKPAEGELA